MFAEKLIFGELKRFPRCALLVLSIPTQLSWQGLLTLGLTNVTRSMPEYFCGTIKNKNIIFIVLPLHL